MTTMGLNHYLGILVGILVVWLMFTPPAQIKYTITNLWEKVKNLAIKIKNIFKKE